MKSVEFARLNSDAEQQDLDTISTHYLSKSEFLSVSENINEQNSHDSEAVEIEQNTINTQISQI